jgi:hypothetical protein
MSLNYHQRRQLHHVEAGLRRADPHLGVMLGIFSRLYPDPQMPGWEEVPQVPAHQSRLRRASARIVTVLAAAGQTPGIWTGDGLAGHVLAGKAITVAASARRAQAPAARRERVRPGLTDLPEAIAQSRPAAGHPACHRVEV